MENRVGLALVLICGIGFCSLAFAAEVPANWVGGSGNWTDATKWSTGVVPNNGADVYDVNIDNGNAAASVVTFPASSGPDTFTIQNLTIDTGDQLTILDRSSAFKRTLNVQGPLTLNGTLNPADQDVLINVNDPGGVAGNGQILFSSNSSLSQLTSTTGTLTVGPNITVQSQNAFNLGFSQGDVGATTFINKGHILANASTMTVSGTTINNQGTFEVSNFGTLYIATNFTLASIGTLINNGGTFGIGSGGVLDNTGQTLSITKPAEWDVGGGTIRGGVIQTSGSGYLAVSGSGTLQNVILNGTASVSGALNVTGTLGGNGTIQVNASFIEGVGRVAISDIPAGITVRGGIDVNFDDSSKGTITTDTNHGVIRAERSNSNAAVLELDSPLDNFGSLQISDGSTLKTQDVFFEQNARLLVDGGGLLDITGELDLPSKLGFLDVLPQAGGGAYNNFVIAQTTDGVFGTFKTVTPGISVNYSNPNEILISGTPTPEPSSLALCGFGAIAMLLRRRGRV